MNSREQQLLSLGFKKNEQMECYAMCKYDAVWKVDFRRILSYNDQKWNILIEDVRYDLTETKKQYFEGLRSSLGYELAQKELKKKLLDKHNHLNSKLSEEKHRKLTKTLNVEMIKELEIQVNLLKEIINEK